MKILTALTYYHPHYSGLTIYAQRLARAFGERGHQVTVLTSRYNPDLPAREVHDGVEVIRPRVLLRVSKGVLMPGMLTQAWKHMPHTDVVLLHLPQFDAAYITLLARLYRKPVVLAYQCDLCLPAGPIHYIANQVSHLTNLISFSQADEVVTTSIDYAQASVFLKPYMSKVRAILPPVELTMPDVEANQSFQRRANLEPGQRIIGMAARLASEKGVEYLVEAMPEVLKRHPTARVLYMGQHQNVMGEEEYARKLAPMIQALGEHWTFLGNLSPAELTAFYQHCEVTVLPSINSTEAFGIVQVESMFCGTPVVASDLPGVRQPVRLTGMGRVVPPMNPPALAQAITDVLDHPGQYTGDVSSIMARFSPHRIAEEYEHLFLELLQRKILERENREKSRIH